MAIQTLFKSDQIMPLGGVYPVIEEFKKVEPLIDTVFGRRVKLVGYQHSEIIRTLMCNYLCGGDRIEDIKIIQTGIEYMPGVKLCSPDTALRIFDELKIPNVTFTAKSGLSYDFNTADKVNDLLVKAAIHQGQLIPGRRYVLDFDHKFVKGEKFDAKYGYKKEQGYWAGVSIMTDLDSDVNAIISVEGQDANNNVKFHQADILIRDNARLKSNGIRVHKGRFDCGSYSEEIVRTALGICDIVYIRAMMSEDLRDELRRHTNWVKGKLSNNETVETLSLPFISFEGVKHCRLVVQRTKKDDPDLFDQYIYRSILTNDWDLEDAEIIDFYNQRGSKEKVFDQMDNDFGWNYLPKSFLDSNTVFMGITAFIRNFYCALLNGTRIVAFGLKSTSRVKSFIIRFLAVPAKWIRKARTNFVNLYTNKECYREIFDLGFS